MGFEEYTKQAGRGRTNEPRISLRKTGSIGVNAAAVDQYFDDAGGAVLYYDADTQRIGIRPTSGEAPNAYILQGRNNTDSVSINAKSFLVHYDLVPDQTTQYQANWDEAEEMVVVELAEAGHVYGSA